MRLKFAENFLALFLVILALAAQNEAHAQWNAESDDASGSEFYILTQECPAEYIAYASSNVIRYLSSVDPSELEALPQDGIISMGTPFSFANADADIFYFPIFCNEDLIYTLRVYPSGDGGYGGVLSSAFVSDLEALCSEASEQTPLRILMEDSEVVAYLDGTRNVLMEYPESFDASTENYDFYENGNRREDDLASVDLSKGTLDVGIQMDVSSLIADQVGPPWAAPMAIHQRVIHWVWSRQWLMLIMNLFTLYSCDFLPCQQQFLLANLYPSLIGTGS